MVRRNRAKLFSTPDQVCRRLRMAARSAAVSAANRFTSSFSDSAMAKSDPTKDSEFQKVVQTFLRTPPAAAQSGQQKKAASAAQTKGQETWSRATLRVPAPRAG